MDDKAQRSRLRVTVGGARVDAEQEATVIERIMLAAKEKKAFMVAFCNVHMAMTGLVNRDLQAALATADLCLPDGAPIAWFIRKAAAKQQCRLSGPDVMTSLCAAAMQQDEGVFLFGGRPETLDALRGALVSRFPRLRIVGTLSPPFRPLTEEEKMDVMRQITGSGAGLVFVGLGCPKQEIWMAENTRSIKAVLLGVGAAFDFHAGIIKRAPKWMRSCGFEWLHRLLSEPKRLFGRYVVTNSQFAFWVARNWARRRELVTRVTRSI